MRFICDRKDLFNNVQLLSGVIPSRPTHPVLGNILIIATEESVQVTGFDLSLGIRNNFKAQVIEEGKATLPAKLLLDILAKLGDCEISVDIDSLSDEEMEDIAVTAKITSPSGKFSIRGMDAGDYPELPTIDSKEVINLQSDTLLKGLKSTLFASSTDETKQILTGIHLKNDSDKLEFAATNGHYLATFAIPYESEETEKIKDFEVTIPARSLQELMKLITSEPTLKMSFDDNLVSFEVGDRVLISRILNGSYPNYNDLIPVKFDRMVTVNRRDLLSTIELVSVLTDQKNNVVNFNIKDTQELILTVSVQDVGNSDQTLPIQFSGDNLIVAFNVKYLITSLKAMTANEININLNEANQPVTFTPLSGEKQINLLMPVQIRD